jgi:hypothetical protein
MPPVEEKVVATMVLEGEPWHMVVKNKPKPTFWWVKSPDSGQEITLRMGCPEL